MAVSSNINPDNFSLGELTTYQVGGMQATAYRALKKHKDELLKDYGITGMQWHIIGNTLDAGPNGARLSDLARTLDTTKAFITNNVNVLEASGILVRTGNKEDGRSRLVKVAPGFVPKCAEIEVALRDKLRQSIYSKVTPQELHTYVKVTARFAELD